VVRRERADATDGTLLSFGPGLPIAPAEEVPLGAKVR
jgi:hypothetical protein